MNDDKLYLGRGWAFPPRFDVSPHANGAVMVSMEEDIKQSLIILFSTPLGQRVFRYQFGHTLRRWVFEGMDLTNRTLMIDSIRQAIINHEPRITVEDIQIDSESSLAGVVNIHVDFTVRQTNTRSNAVFPFYLAEGTNL